MRNRRLALAAALALPDHLGHEHTPKFLVLLDDAPRALLFDGEQQLLGEVIEEDGFIVDNLLRTASECPRPDDIMLRSVVPPPMPADRVRCFELH